MLHLHFSSILSPRFSHGPVDGLILVGGALIEHPTGRPIAHLIDHQWKIGDAYYVRLDYESARPWEVRFIESRSPDTLKLGPFERTHVADGMVYGNDSAIARYVDATDRWICLLDGRDRPVLFFEPVGQPAPRS